LTTFWIGLMGSWSGWMWIFVFRSSNFCVILGTLTTWLDVRLTSVLLTTLKCWELFVLLRRVLCFEIVAV
jgi:hypothetical protein